MSDYCCYLILGMHSQRTYIGTTNNFERRLRQHNGEISGGAKYTTKNDTDWRPMVIVEGFASHSDALKFEWSAKRAKDRKTVISGLAQRARRFSELLQDDKWSNLTYRINACEQYSS